MDTFPEFGCKRMRLGLFYGSRVKGFTLIESLVALLVLSIGLVGMAALYLTAMKNMHASYYRSIASTIALDLEERMWERVATDLNTPGLCLDATAIDEIRLELQNHWRIIPPSSRAGMPNLTVRFTDNIEVVPVSRPQWMGAGTWTERWVEVPITLEWAEARFNDDGPERFDYVTRVPCVSEFTRDSGG